MYAAGRVTIGNGHDVDIMVQGTGVEPVHCHIDNLNGVVTLHPVAEMTSVDGLRVTSATRLTQGQSVSLLRATVNVHLDPGSLAGSLVSPEGRLGALENHKISVGAVRCAELVTNRCAAQTEGQSSRGDADWWRSLLSSGI